MVLKIKLVVLFSRSVGKSKMHFDLGNSACSLEEVLLVILCCGCMKVYKLQFGWSESNSSDLYALMFIGLVSLLEILGVPSCLMLFWFPRNVRIGIRNLNNVEREF